MEEKAEAPKKRFRFLIPSEEDLDKPTESIKKGSRFSSRQRTTEDVEEKRSAVSDFGKEQQPHKGATDTLKGSKAPVGNRGVRNENLKKDSQENLILRRKDEKEELLTCIRIDDDTASDSLAKTSGSKIEISTGQTTNLKVNTNSIIVNAHQRGNPVLKHIKNIPWEFGEIVPDYVLGQKTCALFLSLRYHNFNREYIHERLKHLGNRFELRVLLVLVDVKDPHASLRELSKICILSDCTLILAWSNEEAGRYLETYKSYENKPADALQERVDGDYQTKMIDCLTSVRSVNKTDAVTLMANFGALSDIVKASKEQISLCPGFGPQKAERLLKIFHEPFLMKNCRLEKGENEIEKPQTEKDVDENEETMDA